MRLISKKGGSGSRYSEMVATKQRRKGYNPDFFASPVEYDAACFIKISDFAE
jgi:hypothetical protein